MTLRRVVLLACMVVARPAAAGPYMTGLGLTDLNLFPDGLFPEFSGPLWLGGAYSHGLGAGAASSGVLRLGLAMHQFADRDSLARPVRMAGLDVLVHFERDPYATLGIIYQRGVGPLLIGGGTGIAIRETPDMEATGVVVSPEVSLPLRWRLHRRFTPAAVAFVRVDISVVGRASFPDQALAGVTLALW